MDQYELGVALAVARIAELRRHADRWRLAGRIPGRTARRRGNRMPGSPWVLGRHDQAADCAVAASGPRRGTTEGAMVVQHHHQLVQQEEATVRQAHGWALEASRRASIALWSAGAALLLAAIAVLTG
jgi:hypothetical protein